MSFSTKYRINKDRILIILGCLAILLTILPFLWLSWDLLSKGLSALDINFFFDATPNHSQVIYADNFKENVTGGIGNAILGSFYLIFLALLISFPIGLLTGIYIYKNKRLKSSGILIASSNLLSGIPSIIIGIMAYLWIVDYVHNFQILAGSFALAIIMIPSFISIPNKQLNNFPAFLEEAYLSLGCPVYKAITMMLSSAGKPILGIICRVIALNIGKTAPLLFTIVGSSYIEWNIFESTAALPLTIWNTIEVLLLSEYMWAASLVLFIIVITFTLLGRVLSSQKLNDRYS